MNKTKISVIIPVYNARKYIRECLESILAIKNAEIEIIAVNDESKDNSLDILKDYASKDKRIKVFDKKNSGVSDTRNFGIERASGEWLTFVDCDDKVDTLGLDELISKIDDKMDMMLGTFYFVDEDGMNPERVKFINKDMLTAEDFILNFERLDFQMQNVWCKLYKTQIVKEKNIRFEPTLFNAEDGSFNMDYYKNVNSIRCIDIPVYFYRVRQESSIHHVTMPEGGEASYKHYIGFINYISHFNNASIEDYPTLASFFINMGAINKIAAVSIDKTRDISEIKEVINNVHVQKAVHTLNPQGIYRKIVYKLISNKSVHMLILLFKIKYILLKNEKMYNFVKRKTAK